MLYSEGLQHSQFNPSGYPPEFRRKILELVRSGRSISTTSQEFDVSRQTIMNRMKQDDADSGRCDDLLNSDERKELANLDAKIND